MLNLSQQQNTKLLAWMHRLGVAQKDFREQFSCSPGKGGQNVNKVETAVSLTHGPTGLSVKCHAQRTQGANRYQAWTLLLTKIAERQDLRRKEGIAVKEKLRRQKRGRTRKGQMLNFVTKTSHSRKKHERSKSYIIRMEDGR